MENYNPFLLQNVNIYFLSNILHLRCGFYLSFI